MNETLKVFFLPILLSLIALAGVLFWNGVHVFVLALILSILEITLSFDNAVVNARVLAKMDEKWQGRFLTWGIFVAVVVTRFIFPILIVSATTLLTPWAVAELAFFDSGAYGELLMHAHYAISAFGGAFLLMVSLHYFFDERKDIHWIQTLERKLARVGRIESIELALTLLILIVVAGILPAHASAILFSGIVGVILFVVMQGVAKTFSHEAEGVAVASSAALFVYLNVLDAAFSLDGVVGAFAITNQLIAIVVGLGIGAYFVRTLTVYMVRRKVLDSLVYLEHGAHYAILGLSLAMFASLFAEVPEIVTGLVGIVFVGAAYWSSVVEQRKAENI